MRIDFNISQTEMGRFRTACEAVIRNVGNSTQAATEYAAWEIMSESLEQVPVDTGTLITSAYFGVSERSDVVSHRYGAILGYGTPEGLAEHMKLGSKTITVGADKTGGAVTSGGKVVQTIAGQSMKIRAEAPIEWIRPPSNNVNPKTGLQASTYAGRVHEDLDMPHPNGGKAKFLEDPIRNWAAGKFARTAMQYWKKAIITADGKHSYIRRRTRSGSFRYRRMPSKANYYEFKEHKEDVQRGGEYVRRGESK